MYKTQFYIVQVFVACQISDSKLRVKSTVVDRVTSERDGVDSKKNLHDTFGLTITEKIGINFDQEHI